MQIDLDDTFVEVENMPLDGLRTSLIVDPANGMLPPLVPVGQARIADRPKRSFDDPETFGLAERCLLGNFGAGGGSLASPPMVPSAAIPSFYRIVQAETHVLIFTEWVHDARIVRLNGTQLSPTIRSWLGDSIGHYDGQTLVVDTTSSTRRSGNCFLCSWRRPCSSGSMPYSSLAERESLHKRQPAGQQPTSNCWSSKPSRIGSTPGIFLIATYSTT
jgi:hypothetical protein